MSEKRQATLGRAEQRRARSEITQGLVAMLNALEGTAESGDLERVSAHVHTAREHLARVGQALDDFPPAAEPRAAAPSRVGRPAFLFLSLLLAAAAEYLVTARPTQLQLPQSFASALQPVWPHPGPVVAAIGLFVVSATLFAIVARRAWAAEPASWADRGRRPHLRFDRRTLPPALLALAVAGWTAFQLAGGTYDPSYPRWYVLSVVLLAGSTACAERRDLPRIRRRPLRSLRPAAESFAVLAAAAVFLYLILVDLGSWYFSSIGDEHAFFMIAREMAQGHIRNLFSQDGAYGIIPVLSAYLEGLQMRLFGVNGMGWKLATAVPVALSLPLTYVLARTLYSTRVALVATGLLATSHYLLAYGHTGYPNLEPIFPETAALLLFVWGGRRSSATLLGASGLVAGLGWYTYYPSRSVIVIVAAATLVTIRPSDWLRVGSWIGAGFALAFVPLVAASHEAVFTKMFEQTGSGPTTEVAQNRALLPLWNVGRSLLAFNYNTHDGPYLYGSLLEPVAGGLFVLGLGRALTTLRDPRSRLLLVWFGIGIVVTGVLSKYDYVSVSRLNFLMPVVAILAAVAVDGALRVLLPVVPRGRSVVLASVVAAVVGASAGANLYRWYGEAPSHVPTTPTSVAIRVIEENVCQTAPEAPLVVDTGIGGSTLPALDAIRGIVRPEFALYGDPPTWVDTAPSRCVIFRSPRDGAAQDLMRQVAEQEPGRQAVRECDLSGIVELRVFYPGLAERSGGGNCRPVQA